MKIAYASSYVPHTRLTRNRIRYIRQLICTAYAPHALAHTLKVNERLEAIKTAALRVCARIRCRMRYLIRIRYR